jgi:hypothetical protein
MQISDIVNLLTTRVGYIYVERGVCRVSPALYRQVAEAISARRIRIRGHSPILTRHDAQYSFQESRLEFRGNYLEQPSTNRRLALVLHEASHAVSDLRRITIRGATEEAVAFVAQAMFLLHHGEGPAGIPGMAELSGSAREIAKLRLRSAPVPEQRWNELERAIGAHPNYSRIASSMIAFDGI